MEQIENLAELYGLRAHFVGIKGTGMAALAEIFVNSGAIISGSDVSERFYTDEILERLGIVPLDFSSSNITNDIKLVIYSSAYKTDKNPDLIEAAKKNIPCLLYTQALGLYSKRSFSAGICGVHGKTSTTGIAGTILKELPLSVQVLAGSVIKSFGDSCTFTSSEFIKKKSENNYFVAETCEYQRHFMSFCPKIIVLTSVESDHQDFYPTYSDIQNAFVDYILKLPQNGILIYCADDFGAEETAFIALKKRKDIQAIPYGKKAAGDFHIESEGVLNGLNLFSINLLGKLALRMPGNHEILDATAAVALCVCLLKNDKKNPLDFRENIKKGLLNFLGGKRRSEIIGEFISKNKNNVTVIDDYAHHPTAIKTTLEGFKSFYKGKKIIVDFMSHTYSRTQSLLEEFASSFKDADIVILHEIYSSARENPDDFKINGKTLFEKAKIYNKNVFYYEDFSEACDFVSCEIEKKLPDEFENGILFVTMGAGDNWKVGKQLIEKYKNNQVNF